MTGWHDWLADWLTEWLAHWLTDWQTDWLTNWPTDWLTDWLTEWLTHWLINWPTDWLTNWPTDWLTDWLADWLTIWLTDWLTDWLTIWLTDWLTYWLTDWLTDWLIWLTDWLTDWSCSARLPSKMKLWSSKTKLLCETSFKNEALKIKNEAFLRDFLQKWSFEDQKRSFCARLPSKMKFRSSKTKLLCETSSKNEALKLKNEAFARDFLQKTKLWLWSSKTKLFCEASFKNEALKIKNETFLRDFLQKWSFEAQKRSFSARLPSKMELWRSKTKHFCETSLKNDMLSRHLTSYTIRLAIFKWMLQKYCACHQKVEPRHTKSCNCHAKLPLQSNTSVMKFATFPRIQRRRLQTLTSQSTKSLRLPREMHRFGASSNPPRLPTFLQPSQTPAPATHFETYRNSCACHAKTTLNLKKWSETLVF